jgi:hypothetical protein
MSEPRNEQEILSVELALALRQTAEHALGEMQSLRTAVRDHVRVERSNGATPAQIDGGLKEMVIDAGGESDSHGYSAERVDELTTQVLKWSEGFYSRRGSV